MRKALPILLIFLPVMASGQQASEVPKAEVFAGYSYLNIDTNNLTSRQNANGWETSISGNFSKWLAAEFDVSGHYKTYGVTLPVGGMLDVKVTDYSYLAGPRINFRPVFVHALFGGDHLTGSALGFSASQDRFAGVVGGGVQIPLTRLLSLRASADYALSRHNIFGGPSVSQNNFRASVGIVFKFWGGRAESAATQVPATSPPREAATPTTPSTRPSSQPAPETVALSLGVTGHATDDGFKVTSVREGSPAAQIFLRPGDTLTKIGDRGVKTGQDIDSAIAASATGATKVTGLTQTAIGTIQFEREVKVR